MRLNPVILGFTAAVGLLASCKKDQKPDADRSLTAGQTPSNCCTTWLGDSTITGVITSNLFLQKCKTYKLSGIVYVSNGAELFIETGTRIEGIKGIPPTPGQPGTGTPGGGLVITKGSKIHAIGSPSCPIVFTSDQASPASGDWGGVVILGSAPTNVPTTTVVEGISGTPPADATYGGSNPADNSGELQYVRIEYAGFELGPNNELNGLTLAGVGSGTQVSHVEVFKSNDDAFEFFGGRVNCSYLVAVDMRDDGLDFDQAYIGTIDTALVLADTTRADQSQSNGIECDNNAGGTVTSDMTHPTLNYITIVGVANAARASITNGAPSGTGSYGRAAHFRRRAEFTINNSVFQGWNIGIVLDGTPAAPSADTPDKYFSNISALENSLVHAFVSGNEFLVVNNTTWTSGQFYNKAVTNGTNLDLAMNAIELVSPYNRSSISNFEAVNGSFAQIFPSGALQSGDTWANGWVRLF